MPRIAPAEFDRQISSRILSRSRCDTAVRQRLHRYGVISDVSELTDEDLVRAIDFLVADGVVGTKAAKLIAASRDIDPDDLDAAAKEIDHSTLLELVRSLGLVAHQHRLLVGRAVTLSQIAARAYPEGSEARQELDEALIAAMPTAMMSQGSILVRLCTWAASGAFGEVGKASMREILAGFGRVSESAKGAE